MPNIDFTQLPNKLPYPPTLRGSMSTAHANAITQFLETYTGSYMQRKSIVHTLNCISYMYISGDTFPVTWDIKRPCENIVDVDDDVLAEALEKLFIQSEKVLDWRTADAQISEAEENYTSPTTDTPEVKIVVPKQAPVNIVTSSNDAKTQVTVSSYGNALPPVQGRASDKSDLYIQTPTVPQFDVKSPWKFGYVDGQMYTIYASLPIIPTKQNEISATTNVDMMSSSDLRRLFPTNMIQTRASIMYEPCEGMTLDPVVGLIIPIEGFTEAEIADNIIKYPHLFRLLREVDGELKSFYSTIEIDGELHKVTEIWESLPESKIIPYNKDFVKEYVVRRYLLERDLKHILHRHKLYGTLDPFLTLFTTIDDYIHMGYTDPEELARCCVRARVSYKRSRNPVLRRLSNG